jgi:hypothetical protein
MGKFVLFFTICHANLPGNKGREKESILNKIKHWAKAMVMITGCWHGEQVDSVTQDAKGGCHG